MKYAFCREHAMLFPVQACCRALGVRRKRPVSAQAQRRQELTAQIQRVHLQNRQVYGSLRIYQALRAAGQRVCENTVAKLMHQQHIRARSKRRFLPRTTDSAHSQPVAVNRLDRDFTATAPNQKWVVDITYIPTEEGWLYLAGVLDLYSRRIVGWSMAEHMRESLVADALEMAIGQRAPAAGLLHHSDRGIQYASEDYQHRLQEHQMTISMSRRANCWDNACGESFWASLKGELVHHEHYQSRQQARLSIFEYIEVFYNRQRLHSSLGYRSPEAFEAHPG